MALIQTPSLSIYYRQAGGGPEPLIMLHGNFASGRWWQPLLDDPPPGVTVYVPDLRGCGDTEKTVDGYTIPRLVEDLAAFAQALGLERFHVAGHSLGAAVALQYALGRPHHVLSITLVSPPPADGLNAHPEQYSLLLHLLGHESLTQWVSGLTLHRPLMNQAMQMALPGLEGQTANLLPLVDDALHISPRAIAGYLESLKTWNVKGKLERLDLPVLLLHGSLDPLIPPFMLDSLADALPDVRVVTWPDTGHAPQIERPGRFRALLEGFLSQPREPRALAVGEYQPRPQPAPEKKPGQFDQWWDWLQGKIDH